MSKTKSDKSVKNISNGTFPIEKKSGKKLNKRQRKFRKKLKDRTKLNKNIKSKKLKKNDCSNYQNIPATPQPPIDSKQNNISSDSNFNNYSSDRKRLNLKANNMSKAKGDKSVKNISNGTFPIEKKSEKKLDVRQMNIRKKLKDKKEFKLKENLKSKELEKNNCSENHIIPATPQPLIDSEQDNISSDPNSKNYSSNWKQLKMEISKSKESLPNPRKVKRKHEDMQNTLDMKSNNRKTITENMNTNNKPLAKKNITDSSFNKSVVKAFEGPENIVVEQPNALREENSFSGLTKAVAIDCEMVGGGLNGETNILARVSIVNQYGNVLYDTYVKPREPVLDYRTQFSGIRPENLVDAESFDVVQKKVSELLSGKIVVGHGIKNDFQCLYLSHPRNMIRDTSKFKPFRQGRCTPSLRKLSERILGIKIQSGEHDSIQDAQATMRLYSLHREEWEKEVPKIKKNFRKIKRKKGKN